MANERGGWSFETLEKYLDSRIKSVSDYATAAHADTDRRFKVLDDSRRAFQEQIETRLDRIQTSLDTKEGKSEGFGQSWGILLAVVGAATAIIGTFAYLGH